VSYAYLLVSGEGSVPSSSRRRPAAQRCTILGNKSYRVVALLDTPFLQKRECVTVPAETQAQWSNCLLEERLTSVSSDQQTSLVDSLPQHTSGTRKTSIKARLMPFTGLAVRRRQNIDGCLIPTNHDAQQQLKKRVATNEVTITLALNTRDSSCYARPAPHAGPA